MAISFNFIPNLLRTPGAFVEFDASRAVTGLAALPNRVLLIGSRVPAGSAAALELKQILGEDDGLTYWGNSQLARMSKRFKQASKFTEVWGIGANDDGGAVAATKTITVTGTATSAGTLHFLIHGERVNVAVANGDAFGTIAANIDAAIDAVKAEKQILFTPGTAAGVVTLTCDHAAAFGSDLDVRLNYYDREELDLPSGITIAIADGVAGTTNPDVATVIAVINGTDWFTKWVTGWNDAANMLALESELDSRWGPLVQQDGMIYAGAVGTYSDLATLGNGRNSKFSSIMNGGGVVNSSPTPDFEWAAVTAAVDSNEPDPARPRQTLKLPNVLPPAREDLFDQSERNLLLQNGISTYTADSGGNVYIERLITTYQTNANANPDTTFLNVNTMHTLFALRYTLRLRITSKYPRHKLADDGANYGPGQAIVTPRVIRAEVLAIFGEWELNGWVEDFTQFAEELIIERNATDKDRLDARLGPNLVNQFRVFAGQIQFII